ncbi:MAG: nucleotidyltransferase domain-containing protein [Epsilonproteobacteria bacterium]|nr:nucleotidyltransferase domain-containing protein [Campylobacterota bacterium]
MNKENILNYLSQHKDEFYKQFEVEQIGLFGSYARDEASPKSDVDLLVKVKPDLFNLVRLKEKIENDLKIKVDIIREHKYMKPFFLETIKKDLLIV